MNEPNCPPLAAEILAFWRNAGPERWFGNDEAFDRVVKEKFLDAQEHAARRRFDAWMNSPEGALALIVLLDQFPRNMYRGTPLAFANDGLAREYASEAIRKGLDRTFENPVRRFFYMPMMHSEALADQDICIAKCVDAHDAEGVKFAQIHRDIIARFGRFPHRNAILGRISSSEEQAFLDAGGFAG